MGETPAMRALRLREEANDRRELALATEDPQQREALFLEAHRLALLAEAAERQARAVRANSGA